MEKTLEDMGLDPEARYRVDGHDGVAWNLKGPEMVDGEDTEWSGFQVATGKVLVCMVGDGYDRPQAVDPEDLTVLKEDEFCCGCGQIGCGAYG